MRHRHIAFALAACAFALSTSATAQQRNPVHERLQLAADVAARLEPEFCDVSLARTFQGGLDGINAMPSRSGQPVLTLGADPLASFGATYGTLMEPQETRDEIQRAAFNGMLHAYDKESLWQSSEEAYRYRANGGIGVTLDGSGPFPLILAVAADSQADYAGVQAGDLLREINGASTEGLKLDEVRTQLRGQLNTDVVIGVERAGERLTFIIMRQEDPRPQVTWRIEGNVAIITIPSFLEDTTDVLRDAIRDLRRERRRPAGYIIDVRNNGGGLLDQVIAGAGVFIDGGEVSVVRPFATCRPWDITRYNADRDDLTDGARLVVLVNRMTGSGGEAFAAALRDRRNATLIGQTTFGNARVHTVLPLEGGRRGFLRLSTGVLTAPSGTTWDQQGLTPDIVTEPRTTPSDPVMARAIALFSSAP